MLRKGIRGIWYFFWGHIFALLFYDRKYLQGKWFDGRFWGVCAIGWEWVTQDAVARIILKCNTDVKWPINFNNRVIFPENIEFHPNDLNNFQSMGIYLQAIEKIIIGKGTYIAPNVGIITANHDFNNLDKHTEGKAVIIGPDCWIGMNSVILPGVELGKRTIVGAGAVVTKSFKEGNCIIAGNPAKVIKQLEVED